MTRWTRFLQWLFPALYSPWVKCAMCGCQISRARSVRSQMQTFCSQACADALTDANIW